MDSFIFALKPTLNFGNLIKWAWSMISLKATIKLQRGVDAFSCSNNLRSLSPIIKSLLWLWSLILLVKSCFLGTSDPFNCHNMLIITIFRLFDLSGWVLVAAIPMKARMRSGRTTNGMEKLLIHCPSVTSKSVPIHRMSYVPYIMFIRYPEWMTCNADLMTA